MTTKEKIAYKQGGYRERYAMENGNKAVTHECQRELWTYTYPSDWDYQDANGAIYDATHGKWVN